MLDEGYIAVLDDTLHVVDGVTLSTWETGDAAELADGSFFVAAAFEDPFSLTDQAGDAVEIAHGAYGFNALLHLSATWELLAADTFNDEALLPISVTASGDGALVLLLVRGAGESATLAAGTPAALELTSNGTQPALVLQYDP